MLKKLPRFSKQRPNTHQIFDNLNREWDCIKSNRWQCERELLQGRNIFESTNNQSHEENEVISDIHRT